MRNRGVVAACGYKSGCEAASLCAQEGDMLLRAKNLTRLLRGNSNRRSEPKNLTWPILHTV